MKTTNDKTMDLQGCIEKLKGLNAYDKFVDNLKRLRSMDTVEEYVGMDESYLCKSFKTLVSCAFIWGEAPEGHKFWAKISES